MEWKHLCFLCLACAIMVPDAKAGVVGTEVYEELADSPYFQSFGGALTVEDYEPLTVVMGVESTSAGVIGPATPGNGVDSVDPGGHSLAENDGTIQINFQLGNLPTHVGVVATDWTVLENERSDVTLFAFAALPDINTLSFVDSATGGIADNTFLANVGGIEAGGLPTFEDIFLGVSYAAGIRAIVIRNNTTKPDTPKGIEIDHLQFGSFPDAFSTVPEPSSWILFGCLGCLVVRRIRRKNATN